MNIIVISLKRAVDRRENMVKQLKNLPYFETTILDAVDGKLLSEEEKNKKIHLPFGYRYGETFQPGEIACTMSHIKALQLAKEHNWNNVIILEDDVVLAEDFPDRIRYMFDKLPKDWEHIYLSGIPKNGPNPAIPLFQILPTGFMECTHSMIVKKEAYDKIIDYLSKFETTTDDSYCELIKRGLKSFTCYPFCTYAKDNYTYIWNKPIIREHKSKLWFVNKLF